MSKKQNEQTTTTKTTTTTTTTTTNNKNKQTKKKKKETAASPPLEAEPAGTSVLVRRLPAGDLRDDSEEILVQSWWPHLLNIHWEWSIALCASHPLRNPAFPVSPFVVYSASKTHKRLKRTPSYQRKQDRIRIFEEILFSKLGTIQLSKQFCWFNCVGFF